MKVKRIYKTDKLELFLAETSTDCQLPLVEAGLSAGFPSPAEDYLEMKLDLNKELINNPSSTFYGKVNGNSMEGVGIFDGDILVIDKSLSPKDDSVMVCFIDGEFTVKRVACKNGDYYLMPENKSYKPIKIETESDFRLWGVVTYSIHKLY